jgi:hypothetical protein
MAGEIQRRRRMRIIFAGLTLLIATSAAAPASAEILYPWCRQPAEGGNYCGYSSEAQCQGESVGKGAFCIQNPMYKAPAAAAAPASANVRSARCSVRREARRLHHWRSLSPMTCCDACAMRSMIGRGLRPAPVHIGRAHD